MHGTDADADGQGKRRTILPLLRGIARGGDRLADMAGFLDRIAQRGSRQHDGELLSPVACRHVLTADELAAFMNQGDEHPVPGKVAMGVVDLFEIVDIQQEQGK
jgi:hypothetical protein